MDHEETCIEDRKGLDNMKLPNDPMILYSYVNMKLRDDCCSLDMKSVRRR